MKQQKLTGYTPRYPRKALQGAALTAAALVAIGGAAGCRQAKGPGLQTSGIVPMITEPPEEELVLDGEIAVAEPTEAPMLQGKIVVTEPPEEELILDGEVAICEPSDQAPTDEMTATGIVAVPEGDGQN